MARATTKITGPEALHRIDPKGGAGRRMAFASHKQKRAKPKIIPGRTREAIEAALPDEAVKKLNPRQRKFVKQFLVDLNATQAAIRAGYSPNSAAEIGYENLRKPQIMSAIEEALRQFGGITQTRLIEELGRLAFSDIGNVVAWDNDVEHVSTAALGGPKGEAAGVTKVIAFRVTVLPSAKIDPTARAAVASISQGVGGELRIKMHDKIPAIDKLARLLGMYRDKTDVTSDTKEIVPVLVYHGAPDTILARKLGNAYPPEAVGNDGDESDADPHVGPRLRDWINVNREKLRSRAAVLQAKAEWEQHGQRGSAAARRFRAGTRLADRAR